MITHPHYAWDSMALLSVQAGSRDIHQSYCSSPTLSTQFLPVLHIHCCLDMRMTKAIWLSNGVSFSRDQMEWMEWRVPAYR